MKAAAPFMSAFVIYLITLSGSVLAFRKSFKELKKLKFLAASLFLILGITASVVFFATDATKTFASVKLAIADQPNDPMGVAKGIFPGRVVWVRDSLATNQNTTNSNGDYWFMSKNTSQDVVDSMLVKGMKYISGKKTLATSWDAVFKYFNNNHGKGSIGYKSGEKIVIKINLTTMNAGSRHLNNQLAATPQLVFSLLKQLIDTVGVAQSDISIGDPYRGMPDEIYTLCHDKYADVHYIEGLGTDGREQTLISASDVFFTSDDRFKSRLPKAYLDAAYMINMPSLKTHDAAGITIAAKNHQGSVIGPDQTSVSQYMGSYLHYDYPLGGGASLQNMGNYRHIVDYMAHKNLGGNTLIYIVDAIWSGRNWDGVIEKWGMPPFNNDYTSSLFISQDPVAIESVGFDFLYYEYKNFPSKHGGVNFPLVAGVQDYIHQAADPENWPFGIEYDPNSSSHSSPIASLGVHEHWNNATDKKYSRNLNRHTGTGIELCTNGDNDSTGTGTALRAVLSNSLEIYPNPVKNIATLKYTLSIKSNVHAEIYSADGRRVISTKNMNQTSGLNTITVNVSSYELSTGAYICRLIADNSEIGSVKFMVKK
jgi:hypothetical protein